MVLSNDVKDAATAIGDLETQLMHMSSGQSAITTIED